MHTLRRTNGLEAVYRGKRSLYRS